MSDDVAEFACVNCRAVIPPEDVNVATDKVFCRKCGKVFSFAEMVDREDVPADPGEVPQGITQRLGDDNENIISYRRFSPFAYLLIFFFMIWTAIVAWIIYSQVSATHGQVDVARLFALIPFVLADIPMLFFLIFLTRGETRISMDHGQGCVFIGVGKLGWTRRFIYNRNSRVTLKDSAMIVNGVPKKGICINTDGKDFVFCATIREEVKSYIVALLQREIKGEKSFSEITKV